MRILNINYANFQIIFALIYDFFILIKSFMKKITNKFIAIFSICLLLISSASAQDNKLTLKNIIDSAIKNYPKILAFYQEVEASKASILENKGFFDITLRQDYIDQSRGYYDGKLTNTQLVKRNGFLNSEIYAGYRKSFDDFENYNGGLNTNRDGEFSVGAKFSLLRDSFIDQNRLKLALAKLDFKESDFLLKNIKNIIRRDATKAYYDWIISGEIYYIYKNLYELALERNRQIKIRVNKGDLAQIIFTENQRNVLNRKTAMIKSKQEFENNAIYLSLFYRDNQGKPIIPSEKLMPKVDINEDLSKLKTQRFEKDLLNAIRKRPDLNILKIALNKENLNLKQAKNLYKPKLDVDFSASNDISNEDITRGQSRNEIKVNFEIPLQQRRAKGSIAKAKAKIDKIKFEERLLKETVNVKLSQIKNSVNNIVEMHENLKNEVDLSLKLEEAERVRFTSGGSDFFLINIREQNTASAKIENALIYGEYFKAKANYEAEAFLDF